MACCSRDSSHAHWEGLISTRLPLRKVTFHRKDMACWALLHPVRNAARQVVAVRRNTTAAILESSSTVVLCSCSTRGEID